MMVQLSFLFLAVAVCGQSPYADGDVPVFPFPKGPYAQPFELKLDDSFLAMTLRKVRDFRPTTGLSADWSCEGPGRQNITDVANYWGTQYDWKSVEKGINKEFRHYATTVPGNSNYSQPLPLHFIHHRSTNHDAIPLLLLHGWPSSLLEWSKVVRRLSENLDQPFHVVAPDLPGFGFSPAPTQPGLGPKQLARAFAALMKQLGYDKYGIVTTDLGWFTGMWMVDEARDNIIGHFCDFFLALPQTEDRVRLETGLATAEEAGYVSSWDTWFQSHWAYATVHSQKPVALSLALADSPIGLLGWYWDVNYATSDGYAYTYEQLVTDAMMLWIPGPYANIRAYLEFFQPYVMDFPKSNIPTGVSQWGWDNGPFPEISKFPFAPFEWIKRTANLAYFKKHEAGGHFPAVSRPKLWVEDVREFFYGLETV